MSEKQRAYPYKLLGNRLKRLRETLQETPAEVSGAVEIDITQLAAIEQGTQRPSEDILMLLISHFGIKDEDATKLWDLANYDKPGLTEAGTLTDMELSKQPVMILPIEARIVYTDMVHVMVNNYGVVMNFMQGAGPNGQPLAVARVGMSKDHARSVMELLQETLNQSQAKTLPAPQSESKPNKKQL